VGEKTRKEIEEIASIEKKNVRLLLQRSSSIETD